MDALAHPRRVLLVGGSSEIGVSIVEAVTSGRETELVLAGRDRQRCLDAASDISGPSRFVTFDGEVPETHAGCVGAAWEDGDVDLVVVAHGVLGETESEWSDPDRIRRAMEVNLVSTAAVLAEAARRISEQGHGTLVVLSSIAATRPRRANFVYGAAKAGVDALATGLGEVLPAYGGRVLVVRPGFVHTQMTQGMPPAPFATTPEVVGAAVADALRQGRTEVWVPGQLRAVAAVLRLLPGPLFRRVAGDR